MNPILMNAFNDELEKIASFKQKLKAFGLAATLAMPAGGAGVMAGKGAVEHVMPEVAAAAKLRAVKATEAERHAAKLLNRVDHPGDDLSGAQMLKQIHKIRAKVR